MPPYVVPIQYQIQNLVNRIDSLEGRVNELSKNIKTIQTTFESALERSNTSDGSVGSNLGETALTAEKKV